MRHRSQPGTRRRATRRLVRFVMAASRLASVSRRVAATDAPCIVGMRAILRDCPRDVLSLAQGIVHWSPPEQALARAEAAVRLPQTSLYGADGGDVELVEARLAAVPLAAPQPRLALAPLTPPARTPSRTLVTSAAPTATGRRRTGRGRSS